MKTLSALRIASGILLFSTASAQAEEKTHDYDIVIYGDTSSAVTAAVQASKMGKSVAIVAPSKHLGGLSSGGLGFTDIGDRRVIGGLAREFYESVYQHYQKSEAWTQETHEEFKEKDLGWRKTIEAEKAQWVFEPHVAEGIFDQFVSENSIPVFRDEWLDRENGVKKDGTVIQSITTLNGHTFKAKVFLDSTYEGDLMAAAGVSYHVGREANSTYGETWNGVQTEVFHHDHHFGDMKISPYKIKDDPSSGVLPRISTEDPGEKGSGDHQVQAYCFRMCLSNDPENRVPFAKPEGYDPEQYELLLRVFEQMDPMYIFKKFDPIPNNKTDTNNHGPFSFDNIGMNWDYPEASYEQRKEIIQEHATYQLGMLYFICNDPRVPEKLQEAMREWGLPEDEYTDNGNWSHQLYVREARRMIGKHVVSERDLIEELKTEKSIGMGSYGIDSHNTQRYITPEGHVQNEGDIGVKVKPYEISYNAIVPKETEATNLIVPVAASCSHTAYGSVRMEPIFMILGQSAGTAASIAIDDNVTVQAVDYEKLSTRLEEDRQILNTSQRLTTPK
ncbi:MAG: FAD-dependent oxidoreductase [Luteolibacter sp.]